MASLNATSEDSSGILNGVSAGESGMVPTYCVPNMPEWKDEVVFWIEGVAVCVVGCFGIIGNILTIAVLRR